MGLNRKCVCCNITEELDYSNYDKIITISNKSYHVDCFKKLCTEKIASGNKRSVTAYTEKLNHLFEYISDSSVKNKAILDRNEVYVYICNTYNISILSSVMFTKLDAIYSGTFKGMNVPISPEELLDMWKRRQSYLDSCSEKFASKGKRLYREDLVNYHLAILLPMYDSYRNWKEKEKLKEEPVDGIKEDIKDMSVMQIVIDIPKSNTKKEDSMEISDLLSEVFG